MKIIGINSGYDANMNKINSGSCALIVDGEIITALAEERITREKHSGGFINSYKHILKKHNLTADDIDYYYISFYGFSAVPPAEIINIHLKELGIENHPEKLVVMPSHHLSHAYLAYFLSPFKEAIIVVADNEGSLLFPKYNKGKNFYNNYFERNTYYWAKGNSVSIIDRDFEESGSVGFGKTYNKFNRYIGLGNYLAVGKTMGLSSYGYLTDEMKKIDLWYMDEKGKLFSNMADTNDAYIDVPNFFEKYEIFLPKNRTDDSKPAYDEQKFKNLAFFVQYQLNKWAVKKVEYLKKIVGIDNICVSGGVALNGIMNREIEDKLKVKVFAPAYPSDPGQALGNAIYGYINKNGLNNNILISKKTFTDFTYLGIKYTDEEIEQEINAYKAKGNISVVYPEDICAFAAKKLSEGKILGWYQGKSEYGVRALGNRSIVADPRSEEIRDRVNILKGRELFRPVAPSVLKEHIDEFFDGGESLMNPYMLRVSYVKENKKLLIKGVVHVDQTSRIQSVTANQNPKYYNLINEFYKITGIPMIINTSFNAADEPIVETATNAIDSFVKMNLDGLICNNAYIVRNS